MPQFDQNQSMMLQIQQLLQQLVPLIQQQQGMQQQPQQSNQGLMTPQPGGGMGMLKPGMQSNDMPGEEDPSGLNELLRMLTGQQQGGSPYMQTLENLLGRMQNNGGGSNFTNAGAANFANPFSGQGGSSFMNAQNKANQPVSGWHKFGNLLQDVAPLGAAAGPIGAAGGIAAKTIGMGLSEYNKPYQLPQGY